MKFQVTLRKDDWKWVFTQLDKFTDKKRKSDYRLDCVAIRALSEAEVEFNSCDGTVLGSAVVFADRDVYDKGDSGRNFALFLAKAFKDALAANPKKGKEDVTLRIETEAYSTQGQFNHAVFKERAFLDGVEISTEQGRFPDAASIQTSTMKDAKMPFEVDAKKLKAGLKRYFDEAKADGIKLPAFKADGSICLTGNSPMKAAFMYVRRRVDGDQHVFRKAYGECKIGELFNHTTAQSAFYEEKHYLNAGTLYKISEFMSDTHGLGVERSKNGIHRFYADCEKRARFHISAILMPLSHDKPEQDEPDEVNKPDVREPAKPVDVPEPIAEDVKNRVQDFVADHILRHALNKRIGSNHYSARVLGLVQTLDAVEEEYFRILADVRAKLGGPQFEMIKNNLDQILNDQPDAFQTTILNAIRQSA